MFFTFIGGSLNMLEVRDRKEHALKLLGETHSKVKFVLRGWSGGGGVRDDVGEVANKARQEPRTI